MHPAFIYYYQTRKKKICLQAQHINRLPYNKSLTTLYSVDKVDYMHLSLSTASLKITSLCPLKPPRTIWTYIYFLADFPMRLCGAAILY